MVIPFLGAFESTYLPRHDTDVLETTGHDRRWRSDLALLRACGVTRLRYPVRWHRIECEGGVYDWRGTDEVLGHLADTGMAPVVDLLHHTSYPRWLRLGFADPAFPVAYLRFCEAFARRYPHVEAYTLFNEPFATLLLAGHEGIWPPYRRGLRNLVALFTNVLPALVEASRMYRALLPGARHVYVDTCEAHTAAEPAGEATAALNDDRRFSSSTCCSGAPAKATDRSSAVSSKPAANACSTWSPPASTCSAWTTTPTPSGSGPPAAPASPPRRSRSRSPRSSQSTGSATGCRAC